MYRRTVLRSIPSWRPMAVRLSPCRCSSMIMTSSPTPTTAVAPVRQEQHGWTRNEVGSFRRPLLGSIHRPARDAEMRLARAGAANEDRVALGIQERPGGQFAHLALIDRGLGKDEPIEVLEHRKLGPAQAIADRAGLPMRALGPDQAGDQRIDLVAPGQPLAGDLVEAGAHAVELQL